MSLCSKCGKNVAVGVGLCALCGIFTPTDLPKLPPPVVESANAVIFHPRHGNEDSYIEQQLRVKDNGAITTSSLFVPNNAEMNLAGYRPELFESTQRNELLYRSPKLVPDEKKS